MASPINFQNTSYIRCYFEIGDREVCLSGEQKCTLNIYVENKEPKWSIDIEGIVNIDSVYKSLLDNIKLGIDEYKVKICQEVNALSWGNGKVKICNEENTINWGYGTVKIKFSFIAAHDGVACFSIHGEGLTDINNWTVGMV